jgi:hypothetical protein
VQGCRVSDKCSCEPVRPRESPGLGIPANVSELAAMLQRFTPSGVRLRTGETGRRYGEELMEDYYGILPPAHRDSMRSFKRVVRKAQRAYSHGEGQ